MKNTIRAPLNSSDLAKMLKIPLKGKDINISCISPIKDVKKSALCFSNELKKFQGLEFTLIAPKGSSCDEGCVLEASNPRLLFALALQKINTEIGFNDYSESAQIHPSAEISSTAIISKGVTIGEKTKIGDFAIIKDGVEIGNHCNIKPYAVIGDSGFGFERNTNGIPIKILHLGSVKIGNNVEIGSFTTVCRGTIIDTIINDYVKIDDHVHIAHNVHIEKKSLIIGSASISGSVKIKEGAWIAPNSTIIDGVTIGKNSIVAIGASVVRNVKDGISVFGNPARQLPNINQ